MSASQLFEDFWQWRLQESPEFATFCGFHRYDDKLDDLSLEANLKRKEKCQELLQRVRKLKSEEQTAEDTMSMLLLEDQLQVFIDGHDYLGFVFCMSFNEGPHLDYELLFTWMKFDSDEDYGKLISRLRSIPRVLVTVKDVLNQAIAMGKTPHEHSLAGVIDSVKKLNTEAQSSMFYGPFLKMHGSIEETERERLRKEAVDVIENRVMPAYADFATFLENVYMKSLRPEIGASTLPDGKKFYEACLKWHLSLQMSPQAVHELGVSEVKRIRSEMEEVMQQVGFQGSFKDFLNFLRTDKQFYFSTREELLSAYNDVCENKIRPSLTKLFMKIPETKLIIEESPPSRPNAPVGYYLAGTPDGSRPGKFYINTTKLDKCPKYEMMTLALHEGEPGHHFQSMYALEMKEVPAFRKYLEDMKYYSAPSRFPMHTAYMEGWGLYCEYLGKELGLYDDPYTMFGHLSFEMHRACRLVADTGIHMFGWSYDQACELFRENTALAEGFINSEVMRYITWPGQACAYKVGQLKIKELREKAAGQLGEKFDVREFHEEVLKCGPVPLNILENVIDEYIKRTDCTPGK